MSLQLRPYQADIIEQTRALMLKGCRSILITSPTGSGKTCLTASMLSTSASRNMGSIFVVHRRELIKQSTRTFSNAGVRHGIIAANFPEDSRHLIQIAGVQTLANRLDKIKEPKLIVWDECHHVAAAGWSKIFAAYPDAFHIGLTATPARLDGTGLGKWFKEIVRGPDVRWLIDNGYLSDYKIYAPQTVSLHGVHTRMGDYNKTEAAEAVDKPTITGDAISHYQRLANGKRAVVFCVSIQHSIHVVEQFKASGIKAIHVDGETPEHIRDMAIESFIEGRTQVLSNVDLFGEGFDVQGIEAVILLRPTMSIGLYLQQIGRSLRPQLGKTAIILDHVGNCARHGLPDEVREWSLEGRPKTRSKDPDAVAVKVCPKCFAAQLPGKSACQYCGYTYAIQPREVKQVAGELKEVDPEIIAARRNRKLEEEEADTVEALITLAQKRKYKNPRGWAYKINQVRQAYKMKRGRRA